jgi:nucleotide-binding universal stress UspA family protein
MKNVLLLVHDDVGQEARLQTAFDLVRALGGHLCCLDVTVPPVPIGNPYDGAGEAMLLQVEREREAANKAKLEARVAAEGLPWSWADTTDTIADAVLDAAATADVIVLNRRLDSLSHPDMRDIAGRVVTHASAPVVAVPETLERFDTGRALVAWDGQSACGAALRASVPLLALADEVEIFAVRNGDEGEEPTQAAEYLSRHGIHATIREVADDRTPPDRLIAAEAAEWKADYVVMGAYNRGRLAEIFGGVTKRLLTDSAVPLVLGH